MTAIRKQHGFSLTEMLIATGIMAIGLVMIATIFPVCLKLTGLSVHRSIAAVVADEAFAKARLYGLRDVQYWPGWPVVDPNTTCTDYQYTADTIDPGPDGIYGTADDTNVTSDWGEFLYPSTVIPPEERHRYHWSALCRRTGQKDVQVTVFVTHSTFGGMNYYGYDPAVPKASYVAWPKPVPVIVQYDSAEPKVLLILSIDVDNHNELFDDINGEDGNNEATHVFGFVDEGHTIVNNRDGKIYRVLEMQDNYPPPNGDGTRETIVLYEDWQWDGYDADPLTPPASAQTETVWVVPPGVGSSSYPCVGVFQKVMHFENMN